MIGKPSESEMEEYGEPHGSSKIDEELHLGPNGEALRSQVIPFEPPTKASINAIELPLLDEDFENIGYSIRITFLGDGTLTATIPTARIGEYDGSEDAIEFTGIWYDLEKFKREHAEERRRGKELEDKYESHPKNTDGLEPWNKF